MTAAPQEPALVSRSQGRFAVITDIHSAPNGTPDGHWHGPLKYIDALDHLQRALQVCEQLRVGALLITGDLADRGDDETASRLASLLKHAPISDILIVTGNHDVASRDDLFAPHLGTGGLSRPTPTGSKIGPVRIAGTGVRRSGRDRTMATGHQPSTSTWEDDELVIWMTHFPPRVPSAELRRAGLREAGSAAGLDRTHVLLDARNGPTLVIHGHEHVQTISHHGGWTQLGVAALIEPPYSFAILDIQRDDGGWTVDVTAHRLSMDGPWTTLLCPEHVSFGLPAPRAPEAAHHGDATKPPQAP